MTEASAKTPWHLWLVGVIALLFNAMGTFDFLMWMAKGPAYLEQGGLTPAQVDIYRAMPLWAEALWAIGVFAAVIAATLLLLRRRLAATLFAVSFVTFLLYSLYIYGLAHGAAAMGRNMEIMSSVVAVLLLFFTWYARTMAARGVLR